MLFLLLECSTFNFYDDFLETLIFFISVPSEMRIISLPLLFSVTFLLFFANSLERLFSVVKFSKVIFLSLPALFYALLRWLLN